MDSSVDETSTIVIIAFNICQIIHRASSELCEKTWKLIDESILTENAQKLILRDRKTFFIVLFVYLKHLHADTKFHNEGEIRKFLLIGIQEHT